MFLNLCILEKFVLSVSPSDSLLISVAGMAVYTGYVFMPQHIMAILHYFEVVQWPKDPAHPPTGPACLWFPVCLSTCLPACLSAIFSVWDGDCFQPCWGQISFPPPSFPKLARHQRSKPWTSCCTMSFPGTVSHTLKYFGLWTMSGLKAKPKKRECLISFLFFCLKSGTRFENAEVKLLCGLLRFSLKASNCWCRSFMRDQETEGLLDFKYLYIT